jgi:osmotically-inducible protein OsmY
MRDLKPFPLVAVGLAAAMLSACVGAAVVGGAAAVGSTVMQDRGVKGAISDQAIRAEINHNWTSARVEFLSDLNLQIYEGRVLVSGEVKNADLRAQAIQLAWKASGVREVINEVEVSNVGGIRTYASDSWIKGQLDGKLLVERGVTSPNYSTEVFAGVIYLLGVAQSREELDKVVNVARNISGVKRVANHVLMRDDPARFKAPAS